MCTIQMNTHTCNAVSITEVQNGFSSVFDGDIHLDFGSSAKDQAAKTLSP